MSNIDYSALINDEETLAAEPATLSLRVAAEPVADEGQWIKVARYLQYDGPWDNDVSIIDKKKQIELHENQVSLTQENKGQFIPFELDLYQDSYNIS
jgi:hypothetical protein